MASTLGTLQPFRYRGYVWDEETGLYYLRSRYYKAVIFRFLSNDVIVSKIGEQLSTNAYIYSKNNSVVCADADGTDCYYVIYDNRENGKEKGLRLQGEWAISFLESIGHDVECAGFTDIPGFARAWNNIGTKKYDYIVIYAHGSPGTIDCNGGYLKETLTEYKDSNDHYCYSSKIRLSDIQVTKGIILLSCNAATPDSEYMTAIGMLSSKAGGAPTTGSAYASVNYYPGTGIPKQGPGISGENSLWTNISRLLYYIGARCWVTFSKDGYTIK